MTLNKNNEDWKGRIEIEIYIKYINFSFQLSNNHNVVCLRCFSPVNKDDAVSLSE